MNPAWSEEIDWGDLKKRLTVTAFQVVRSAQLFDCGVSPDDVVTEVLLEFFESPRALGWNPKKGKLGVFLGVVLKRRLTDHLRREKYVARSSEDEESREHKPDGPVPWRELDYEQFAEQILKEVDGDQELEDYVAASLLVDGGHNMNQQMAEILVVSESEVVNRKRRLMRHKGLKKLYEQRQKKR